MKQYAVWFNQNDIDEYNKVKSYLAINMDFKTYVKQVYIEQLKRDVREYHKQMNKKPENNIETELIDIAEVKKDGDTNSLS